MKRILFATIVYLISIQTSQAALLGSQLSLETIFQSTSASPIVTIGVPTTATVTEPGIEFQSLRALAIPGSSLVDVSINAGDNFIEIDFDNARPPNLFTSAFRNGYLFTFASAAAINITGASIDTGVTSLGLSANDLIFSGNQLFVNVEGLSFNTSTFARINLTSEGGVNAVPLPGTVWLFGCGLLALIGFRRQLIKKPVPVPAQ